MNELLTDVLTRPFKFNVLMSVGVIIILITSQWFMRRLFIKTIPKNYELRNRWVLFFRRIFVLGFLLAMFFIWGNSLRHVALTLTALVAASLIACKELLLCMLGSFVRLSGQAFYMGDRIRVGDSYGDVVDQTLLTTVLAEIGDGEAHNQSTGRRVTIPNSLFLNTPIYNESMGQNHTLHSFIFSMKRENDWMRAKEILLECSEQESVPVLEEVKKAMNKVAQSRGWDPPTIEPRVTLDFSSSSEVNLIARVPCRVYQISRVERNILFKFTKKLKEEGINF